MTSEEQLMAYVDGELPAGDRTRLEQALGSDEHLRAALAREQLLRRKLSRLYDPVLEERVPDRLTGRLAPDERRVVSLFDPSAGGARWWRNVTALAATLALGIFVGQGLNGSSDLLAGEGPHVADGRLAQALDTQLASTQSVDAPVQVGISFVGPDGSPCRTFESPSTAGLACRSEDRWELLLLAPARDGLKSEYQQAASASALVMKSAQELATDEPMNALEERRARDAGWPAVAE